MAAPHIHGHVGLYRVSLTVGTHAPGAPTLTLHLLVNAPTGSVTGSGDITQAIAGPDSNIPVTKIHGKLVQVGPHIVVNLEGTGLHTFPPPAIGTAEGPVEIHLVLNDKWEGHGSYTYFGHDVKDVPVKQIP